VLAFEVTWELSDLGLVLMRLEGKPLAAELAC
jgi:hypothetical protein